MMSANSNAISASVVFTTCAPSLADEIREAEDREPNPAFNLQLPTGVYFDYRNTEQTDIEEDASPDSKYQLDHCVDFDSGNSTTHSPDGAKCFSPTINGYVTPPSPASSCGLPNGTLELLEGSHRGLHKFIPRHVDEIEVEIGDPVYVQKEADDLWCEGVNLRSGKRGIFPGAYVIDVDYSDFDPDCVQIKKERYLLKFLGSLEVFEQKGNQVLCQAVYKIVVQKCPLPHPPHHCILEVSDQGLRIVDKSKPPPLQEPCHDYFFSLKNVTFCGYHPNDHRYFGFVTKHPSLQRFACHIFSGDESTRSVAEAVGRAFHRFYHKFIETAYPVEDIYLE
uniref:SH3 domain-containing protein n=1 Tax=Strigamia maritima TaxID=126957 RepID=T1JCJ8_STRMM